MDTFWKSIGLILIGVILWVLLDKREKDLSVLLTLAVCIAAITAAAAYIKPVMELVWQLNTLGNLHDGVLKILLKAVGIGFAAEITAMVCVDAGNSSMAGIVRFLECAMILYVSIPIFSAFIGLIQEILGIL